MIKKGVATLLLAFGISHFAYAQSDISDLHQKTAVPNNARYDIVQSELAAKWTFRVDRYYGKVSQLVRTSDDGNAWENMPVKGLPKISIATKPKFLIFTSGLAARHTYLLDTVSGKTWTLTTATVLVEKGEPVKVTYWEPFEN